MTKKLAALALSLALPTLAAAGDINPGALQLSGTSAFGWGTETVKSGASSEKTSRVDAGLSAMYYVSHFLAFGLDVGYQHQKVGTDYESAFLFGPKGGLDWELMKHLSLFGDLTVGIARGETKTGGVVETADGYGYEAAAGFRLFFNPNVSLDLFGKFHQVRLAFPAETRTTSDASMGVGISVYLTNNPANSADYRPEPRQEYPYR